MHGAYKVGSTEAKCVVVRICSLQVPTEDSSQTPKNSIDSKIKGPKAASYEDGSKREEQNHENGSKGGEVI